MPELPEVEVICRGLKPLLINQKISNIFVRNYKLRWPVSKEIINLKNKFILNVTRRAKYLILKFECGWLIIHFGMSGCLQVITESKLFKKHDHIDLIMNNGVIIRYSDPRRFGCWLWSYKNPNKNHFLFNYLGLEPLSKKFSVNWFYQISRNRNIKIKSFIMNNKIVVGIGNIYSNESLFLAKILPNRLVKSLTYSECFILVSSIKKILLNSIKLKGTTICNFLFNGKSGDFFKMLKVYKRYNMPCKVCGTLISIVKFNGRNSFFCIRCQI